MGDKSRAVPLGEFIASLAFGILVFAFGALIHQGGGKVQGVGLFVMAGGGVLILHAVWRWTGRSR